MVDSQVEGSYSEQTGKADTARLFEVKDACSKIQRNNRPKGKDPDLIWTPSVAKGNAKMKLLANQSSIPDSGKELFRGMREA